jgi:phosphoribosyl 1,2-cyclic phosphate phosphodiesterase
MKLTVTIMGCGSSGGVPRIGNDWGSCDPANPRNFRRRCSLLLEQTNSGGKTSVVIDTSPDFRDQALATNLRSLDGVWYTHEHADHTHGIDELRGFYLRQRRLVPIWADKATLKMLKSRFSYCFRTSNGSGYPPVLESRLITPGKAVITSGSGGDILGLPFVVEHGTITALGFRIGDLAYTPDLNGVPETSHSALEGLHIWIVDALRRTPHSSHFHLDEALRWIDRMKPKTAILTNMHNDMDFATLERELPPHVKPAYDGMQIEIERGEG